MHVREVEHAIKTITAIRDALLEEAWEVSNMRRQHNFDSAFVVMTRVDTLWRAQRILEEEAGLDGGEESPGESSRWSHPGDNGG